MLYGGFLFSYYSDTHLLMNLNGYTTECRLGMIFFTWFIVKLYFHVTFFITCHILIVSNDIIYMIIKVIYWSWLVGDVTYIPDFSDYI